MEGSYSPEAVEEKWQEKWVENQTYKYSGSSHREEVFSIDTPPPTVSGSLHMGHLYGQTLQDFMARFQRMRGKKVFQPFGYDDNGIASERLTEKELGIRHQDFTRREFQEKCREVCQEYEEKFTKNMQSLGISHDWTNTYKTIKPRVQRISQLSFIDLYEKDREYRKKAPAIWCPECETAISQVETEDAERNSHFNDIEFKLATGNGSIIISTTRPELIPACVAIFVHPDDETNDNLVGEKAEVPLFGHEVQILEDERVDMEKGTGVVMCCTFGDQTDIEWYNSRGLELRTAIDESGTMTDLAGKYEGMSTKEAREAIVDDLDDEGVLLDREAITHTIQVHERCGEDIEFRITEQWYVKLLDRKEKYLKAGEQMEWFPEKMKTRYRHWIEGLEWDWCVSRQRDSGIPFPVWYCKECGEEVIAEKDNLPVDPIEDSPPVHECPECKGEDFKAEEDVFDTWATSSLTPLINAHWDWQEEDQEFEMGREELYPISMRPQAHDIISFWLFHTIIKCYEHTGEVPFRDAMITGFVLDENREKMSKSKGNVVSPEEVLEEYPVDAARYWAARSKLGNDFAFQEDELEEGEKLMRKIWNASKLVDQLTEKNPKKPEELEEIDAWILAKQDQLIEELTEYMENYEFSKARDTLRSFFWDTFCGDYLEITKQRLDAEESQSAIYTLRKAHKKFMKLFAPILSHITEEIWNEMYTSNSIHTQNWPKESGEEADLEAGENAIQVISALRKYKSSNQVSLKEEIKHVQIFGNISGMEEAIKEVMHVQNLEILEEEPEMEKKVVEISLDYSKAGPKYGDKIGEIEGALENEEWMLDGGRLEVAGEQLKPEEFEVRDEVTCTGEGDMLETNGCIVIVE